MEEHYIKDVGKITYEYGVNLEEHKTVIEKQQKRIAELEQELAELKEKDNYHLRYELAGADETIVNLKKQLEEKDKEIEKLKQQNTLLENENGKLAKELIVKNYKKAQKEVSFGIQLAIKELEKVKEWLEPKYFDYEQINYLSKIIDQQIKELKGE